MGFIADSMTVGRVTGAAVPLPWGRDEIRLTERYLHTLMPPIHSPDDPRLEPFIAMRDRDLRRETGLCLAEGEHLVRRAFDSGLRVRSVLVVEQKADRVEAMLAESNNDGIEVLTCTKAVLEDAVGFELHQGIVAAVEPPAEWDGVEGLGRAVEQAAGQGRPALMVCPEITNAENLGLLARVAAAMGVGAMVLGPRCGDPWYRRAVRVSMGAVFKLPMVRLNDLDAGLNALRDTHGYALIATVTDPHATALQEIVPADTTKPAILLGSEGYGLSPEVIASCDQRVRIPMHAQIDSLNVAVAAGIVLYQYGKPGHAN